MSAPGRVRAPERDGDRSTWTQCSSPDANVVSSTAAGDTISQKAENSAKLQTDPF